MHQPERKLNASKASGSLEIKSGAFNTTHWSVVLAAGKDDFAASALALEQLCRTYQYPIYAFIRWHQGADHHAAQDLTQGFFAHVLAGEVLKKAAREKGRFRNFLLAILTKYLNSERAREHTLKRGGKCQIVSLDEAEAQEFYGHEPAQAAVPAALFDRRWALALVNRALLRLKTEYLEQSNGAVFETLEPALTKETKGQYEGWAAQLGMKTGAVKVAVSRLRRRFGDILRSEVAQTASSPAEIEEELRHLLAAIAD